MFAFSSKEYSYRKMTLCYHFCLFISGKHNFETGNKMTFEATRCKRKNRSVCIKFTASAFIFLFLVRGNIIWELFYSQKDSLSNENLNHLTSKNENGNRERKKEGSSIIRKIVAESRKTKPEPSCTIPYMKVKYLTQNLC